MVLWPEVACKSSPKSKCISFPVKSHYTRPEGNSAFIIIVFETIKYSMPTVLLTANVADVIPATVERNIFVYVNYYISNIFRVELPEVW